jgi:OOP family OmpA-OmpF porin
MTIRVSKYLTVAAVAVTMTAFGQLSFAHSAQAKLPDAFKTKGNAGHVVDANGFLVIDGGGQCVLTPEYDKAKHGLEVCGEVEPKPAAAPPAPAPAPTPVVQKTTLNAKELFDFDSAKIKATAAKDLDGLAGGILGLKALDGVEIVGHTCSIGTDAYNQKLSERRAAAVKDYLVKKGVPAGKITTSGMGEKSPVASNKTKDGRAANRRVEVTVKGSK